MGYLSMNYRQLLYLSPWDQMRFNLFIYFFENEFLFYIFKCLVLIIGLLAPNILVQSDYTRPVKVEKLFSVPRFTRSLTGVFPFNKNGGQAHHIHAHGSTGKCRLKIEGQNYR